MKNIIYLIVFNTLVSWSNSISQEKLSGNWGGSRKIINEFGIDIDLVYTSDYVSNISGGISKGADYLDNIDITANFNLEKIFGWNGTSIFAYVLGNHGGIPNNRVGTLQGISNISAYNTWKLYEFWIEKNVWDSKLSILFGLFDLNSEFDVQETSGVFINPSHGIGAEFSQTGKNGPSIFPNASLSIRIKFTPTDNSYFLFGAFDGDPGNINNLSGTHIHLGRDDGLLLAYEMGLLGKNKELNAGYEKYSLGGWYYTSQFTDLTSEDNDGNHLNRSANYGFYLSAEKFLFPFSKSSARGLAAFLRFGVANGDINNLDYYWGLGFNLIGPINNREEDIFGIAIGTAHAGQKYASLNSSKIVNFNKNEIIIEATYSFQATPWLRIQPDFQFALHPLDNFVNDNAKVAGVRFEVIF